MAKPRIQVTREVFDEVLEYLGRHFEVSSNQATAVQRRGTGAALADKDGAMTVLTDRIDACLLARCPRLKAVCNIAVGFNNFDLPALSARGVMAPIPPACWTPATPTSPGR